MHRYRSHTCGALRADDTGSGVRLSGWVHRVRDHGGVLFIDLRDHYGITQVVADPDSPCFAAAEKVRAEWVLRIDGDVKARDSEAVNDDLPTGAIEVFARDLEVLSAAAELPLPVFGEPDYPEDIRLKYRFLDLRRETLHSKHHDAHQDRRIDARKNGGCRFHRILDADPDRILAGRGARFPRALAPASWSVLCAAASTAAI